MSSHTPYFVDLHLHHPVRNTPLQEQFWKELLQELYHIKRRPLQNTTAGHDTLAYWQFHSELVASAHDDCGINPFVSNLQPAATPQRNLEERMLAEKCGNCMEQVTPEPYDYASLKLLYTHLVDIVPNSLDVLLRGTMVDVLSDSVGKLDHVYRSSEQEGNPTNVEYASLFQRLTCYSLLESLRSKKTIVNIGNLIDANPKDGKTEHGGLIMANNGELAFVRVPSAVYGEQSYGISNSTLPTIPHLAKFHLHALMDDCTRYAGPSFNDSLWEREESDMGQANEEAGAVGLSHNVVITKLDGKKFNVDYYGSEMGQHYAHPFVLDLGVYSY